MPNWVQNQIIIKGTKEQTLAVVNEILENSNEEKCKTLDAAIDKAIVSAKHKEPNEDKTATTLVNGLQFSSLFPIPDTFLLNDTTNFAKDMPDAVEEQMNGWGVVGWYDYNLRFFGCKWDCEMSISMATPCDGNESAFCIECETPWSAPHAFLERMMEKFGVKAYIASIDEGLCFAFYGEVGGELHDVVNEYLRNKEEDEDEDEDLDDYEIIWEDLTDKLYELW